jgi:hypothetical protein
MEGDRRGRPGGAQRRDRENTRDLRPPLGLVASPRVAPLTQGHHPSVVASHASLQIPLALSPSICQPFALSLSGRQCFQYVPPVVRPACHFDRPVLNPLEACAEPCRSGLTSNGLYAYF